MPDTAETVRKVRTRSRRPEPQSFVKRPEFRAELNVSLEGSGAGTPQAGARPYRIRYHRQTIAPPVMPAPAAVIRMTSPL